jgi:glutamate N-acetyltransferase / amino-acid N-acetyltransferase
VIAHRAAEAVERMTGGITAPLGFRASGVACGIKANGALDLALVACDELASAAGVFTTNRAPAAPVLLSREHLRRSRGRAAAVVINSGCANACTGAEGAAVAESMAADTARALSIAPAHVLVASTGVIGVALDGAKAGRGIAKAAKALGRDGDANAARAIMTTDPSPKSHAASTMIDGSTVRVGGMAKGSGMIEPQLATMLGVVTTDAAIGPTLLKKALKEAVAVSFNAISVDGECSTNDCVFLLASGASGVTIGPDEYRAFVALLTDVCQALAIDIVRGGEGATKLVTVTVRGAASDADARKAARAICNSLLVKTAVHGGDPNWGRLIAVAGRAGVALKLDRSSVRVGDVELFAAGRPHDDRAPMAAKHLRGREVSLEVDLGSGKNVARMWTCDLSAEYVRINAEYRT